jgi:hypothetical protein
MVFADIAKFGEVSTRALQLVRLTRAPAYAFLSRLRAASRHGRKPTLSGSERAGRSVRASGSRLRS